MPTARSEDPFESLKPVWRAFVVRPTGWAALAAAFLAAGAYFFWQPLHWTLGSYAWIVPGVAALLVVGTFVERSVRYGKTRYAIGSDRIVVETGTLFHDRSVELDLEKITLVEWNSPFFLRILYDAGHVTIQEAGSAERPAHLSSIAEPERVYQRVGELMGARGFSMSRDRTLQQETPGHLGALVDLAVLQAALLWVVILVAFQAAPVLVGEGPTLVHLVTGDYAPFADLLGREVFARIRAGTILLGGVVLVGYTGWLVMVYLDYLHREYTLYEGVIDYFDGFLNETRRFIPLENVADSQVSRPVYKRILGLSDVTLSSQGAGNDIHFQSTPNGPAFARSIERRAEEAELRAPRSSTTGDKTADDADSSPSTTVDAELTLQPSTFRAALRGGIFLPPVLLFAGLTGLPVLVGAEASLELGPLTIASVVGLLFVALVVGGVSAAGGGLWWIVRAAATSFEFDRRGARRTFDLISRDERRFALEQITSVSILRNPLDWIANTATIRFRSVGAEESLDFWGVDLSRQPVDEIRPALGLTDAPDTEAEELTPEYRWADGFWAFGPIYVPAIAAVLLVPVVAGAVNLPERDLVTGAAAGLLAAALLVHQTYRALYHGRIRGSLSDAHLEIEGGIVRRWRHLAATEDIRTVDRLRYPASEAGRLTFGTAGFPIRVAHVPEVESLHERIDRRLGLGSRSSGGANRFVALDPSPATEALRWAWTLLAAGAGLLVMPAAYLYFHRVDYTVEPGRLVADAGIYFDRRTTILFDRVDHIESNRTLRHRFTDTHDIRIYTVGSRDCDLVVRSVPRAADALELVRERLGYENGDADRPAGADD